MCDKQVQQANALINAQSQGVILVMVAWFLACLLALCTVARIIHRLRSTTLHSLPLLDDVIVAATSLCALGSILTVSTAVDSGLGQRRCLMKPHELEQVQIKVYISTLLFVLTISISKASLLLLLHKMTHTSLQRSSVIAVGILVMLWTIAVLSCVVFQCEMPQPWEIWTGKCIPLLPFWITAIAVDIVIELIMVVLSIHIVWSLQTTYNQKSQTSSLLSIRLLLVVASIIRLYYIQRALSPAADATFDFIPYAITTQVHTAFAAMLSCIFALSPLLKLRNPLYLPYPAQKAKSRHSKHWSGTTVGGTPYESYDSFAAHYHSRSQIIKEPLPSIQASMSNPTSPAASRKSLIPPTRDVLLPDVLLPTRCTRAPPRRPPPPTDAQRPDLSIFTKKTVLREPPMVTRLGSVRSLERSGAPKWERVGRWRFAKESS